MATALITISGRSLSFKLRAISPGRFPIYLRSLKNQFPLMHWNPEEKVWQLPVDELQAVYEACRALCGPARVHLAIDYKSSAHLVQPSLFD